MSAKSQSRPLYCPASGCGRVFLKRTGRDVLHYIDQFLARLATWPDLTCCPRCFIVLAQCVLTQCCGPDCQVLNFLQLNRHDFWIACLRLIILIPETNLPQLKDVLRANMQKCPRRALHHEWTSAKLDLFDAFVESLCDAVTKGLTDGKRPIQPGESDAVFKYFHKRHGHWPVTPEQLFPLGVQRGVDALVFWCCAPVSSEHMSLMTTFLSVARADVLPRVLAPPNRERLVWAIIRALTLPRAAPRWPAALPPPFAAPPGAPVRPTMGSPGHMVLCAMTFLSLLREDFDARTHETARFLAGYERPLRETLQAFVAGWRGGDDADAVSMAREYLAFLAGEQQPRSQPQSQSLADFGAVLHEFLERRKATRRCANAACEMSEEQTGGRAFQQCANCRYVRYCSRACQQQDWRAGAGARHRDVCPVLCKVLASADPQRLFRDQFSSAFAACGMDERDVDFLRQWVQASGLIPQSRYAPA